MWKVDLAPGAPITFLNQMELAQRLTAWPAFLTRRVNKFVAPASWPAVAWVSRPRPDAVCSVTVCANGIGERGLALAARTPPVQPTRTSALRSVNLAVRSAA